MNHPSVRRYKHDGEDNTRRVLQNLHLATKKKNISVLENFTRFLSKNLPNNSTIPDTQDYQTCKKIVLLLSTTYSKKIDVIFTIDAENKKKKMIFKIFLIITSFFFFNLRQIHEQL